MIFRNDYIKNQIDKRKGVCGKHGCCDFSLVHKIWNKHIRKCLSKKDRRQCLFWDNLPKECKIYPFDEKDKIPETKEYCNFYWEEERKDKYDEKK